MDQIVVKTGTDWLTPVATLVAVIVGGGVTWLVQWALAKRRENGEAKASARMIQGDLAMVASRLKDMVADDPRWYGFTDLTLPNWDRHAPILALRLESTEWEAVSQSALELAGLTDGMRRALGPGGPREGQPFLELSEKQRRGFRVLWDNATKAYNTLARSRASSRCRACCIRTRRRPNRRSPDSASEARPTLTDMKVALTIAGAVAEFVALGLLVWDFYEARRQAEQLMKRPAGGALEQQYAVRPEDMSPEQRAAELKAQVVLALTAPSREDLHAVHASGEDMRAKVADALRGSGTRKWASIVLLTMGITCSAVANLI